MDKHSIAKALDIDTDFRDYVLSESNTIPLPKDPRDRFMYDLGRFAAYFELKQAYQEVENERPLGRRTA